MRKSWQVFHDRSLLLIYFWSFVLPVLEYCSTVRRSAADSHIKLLDRVVRGAGFSAVVYWSPTLSIVGLWQCCACYSRLRVTQCII